MAEQNFSSSSSGGSQNSVAQAAEVTSFHVDAHLESDSSIKLHFPFVTEFSSCQVLSVPKIAVIPGSLDSQSSLIYLPEEILSQPSDKVDENSRADGPSEIMFMEKVNLETAEAKSAVFCVSQFDRLKDVASEMSSNVVQNDQENSNASVCLNALATDISDDKELNTEGSENVSTGVNVGDIVEPDDDASQNLRMHSAFPLAETGLNEDAAVVLDSFQGASQSATFAEHNLSDLSRINQNVDENQTEWQNLTGITLAASHLTSSENEIAERKCCKLEGESSPGNLPSSSHRRRDLGFNPDSPTLAKSSPIGLSTAPSSSKVKTKRSGHLVIDGLAPKPSTSSRKSGRSKRTHSNSAVAVKHGEVKHRTKDEAIKSRLLSSADTNRRQDVLNCLTDDANRCIEDLQNFNVGRTKKEDVFGEASFHLTAMKPSAAQIGDQTLHRSSSYRIATAKHENTKEKDNDAKVSEETLDLSVTVEDDSNSSFPSHLPATQCQNSSSKLDLVSGSPLSDKAASAKVAARESTEPRHGADPARKGKGDRRGSSSHHHSDHGRRLSLAKDLLLLSPTALTAAQSWSDSSASAVLGAADLVTTPTKTSGIRRLKELFMDRSSPKDGSSAEPQHFTYDTQHASASSAIYEGQLNAKNTMMDGKRSTERTWKSVHAILRGHHLYFHPDKISQNVLVYEHPISVRSALVDIAYDYVKRKNVFRLTTYNISEYLLEAEDQESMLSWIKYIQESGYSHSDKEFSSRELARQKRLVSQRSSHHTTGHDSSRRKHSDSQRSPRLASKIPEPVGHTRTRKTSRELSKSPQRDVLATDEEATSHKAGGIPTRFADNSEQKSKDHTWTSKVVKKLKRLSLQTPATPSIEQTGAFGVELDKCVPSANNEFVPLIVDACITIVESKGLTNRGIYRVPGNSAAIAQLQAELNKDPTSINLESEKWQDVNAVISLLKLFFRELPYPLITKELYPSMIEANRVDDSVKRMLKIKRLIHHLPMHNFETLHFLARHLNKVASVGDVNMMDARNLAIIFGPTLLQPKQDMVNMVKDMSDQCRIVESIIQHCGWFFSSWDEDVNVPADGEKDSSTIPITGMDQQLLEKAEHMVLEEQTSSSRRLWRPNVARKANVKERYASTFGGLSESNNERTVDEEMSLRSGVTGDKRSKNKNDEKNAKMRAKSVPPRPVSTLNVHGGRLVEKMTEAAAAKRKNSSPVTINRRESAIPPGVKSASRHQFHRSSSEMSEKHYRISTSTKGRQPLNISSSRHPDLEQRNNKRQKSVSSQMLFNAKLAQSQKSASGLTPQGSQEKLGSPHSSRSSHFSNSRSTIASDVGDVKRKKGLRHHAKTEGIAKASQQEYSAEPEKENLTRKAEQPTDTEKKGVSDDENQETETYMKSEIRRMSLSDSNIQVQQSSIDMNQGSCVMSKQVDGNTVWNATDNTWNDISMNKDISSDVRKGLIQFAGENVQMLSPDLPAVSLALISKDPAQNEAECLNVFTEKLNLNLEVSSKDRHSESLEIADLAIDKPVVCEEKENYIDVVFSENTEIVPVRLTPICKSHIKARAHGIVDEISDDTTLIVSSLSHDSDLSKDVSHHLLQTETFAVNRDLGKIKKPRQLEILSPQNCSGSSSSKQQNRLKSEEQPWSSSLDGTTSNRIEPTLSSVVHSHDRVLERTSSEPSMVLSPIITRRQIRPSPGKDTTTP